MIEPENLVCVCVHGSEKTECGVVKMRRSKSLYNTAGLLPCKSVVCRLRNSFNDRREPLIRVFVKASTVNPNRLGACICSQQILMILEEKGVPYIAELIDTEQKPSWFLQLNPEACIPAVKIDGYWYSDVKIITEILEKKYPWPSIGVAYEDKMVASGCAQYLEIKKFTEVSEAAARELRLLNEHLRRTNPYIRGDNFSVMDALLAPVLYQMEIVLQHHELWSDYEDGLAFLWTYMKRLFSRASFIKTKSAPETVLQELR